jgi:hypothetical protein
MRETGRPDIEDPTGVLAFWRGAGSGADSDAIRPGIPI